MVAHEEQPAQQRDDDRGEALRERLGTNGTTLGVLVVEAIAALPVVNDRIWLTFDDETLGQWVAIIRGGADGDSFIWGGMNSG